MNNNLEQILNLKKNQTKSLNLDYNILILNCQYIQIPVELKINILLKQIYNNNNNDNNNNKWKIK